ncbi:hypothetical protein Tco_0818933 [Tanacetum coccineum]
MVINSPCLNSKKELVIPEHTATGKELTNPLMDDSLPKIIMPTKLVKPQDFNLRPNLGHQSFKFQEFNTKYIQSFGEAKAAAQQPYGQTKTLSLPY